MSDIFANLRIAMGGDVVDKVQSIRSSADCKGPNGSYTTNLQSTRDGKFFFEQLREGERPFQAWIIGKTGMGTGQSGDKLELGSHHVAMIKSHDFQMIPINFQERYEGIEIQEQVDFKGKLCHKVQFIDEMGQTCHAYFDAETDLWAGMALANSLKQDGSIVTITINNWQEINDVLLPQSVTATDAAGDFQLQFRDFALNTVDEKIFT